QTYPALFGLYRLGLLPKDIHVVGYARTKMDAQEYYRRITSYIKKPDNDVEFDSNLEKFKAFCTYISGGSGGYVDGASFDNLNKHLESIEEKYQTKERNRL